MKLKFLNLGLEAEISNLMPSIILLEENSLFQRVIYSLRSGEGALANEPYILLQDDREISSSKVFVFVSDPTGSPWNNSQILKKLYENVETQLLNNYEVAMQLTELESKFKKTVIESSLFTWGKYEFTVECSVKDYLKAYMFKPSVENDASIFENCIALLNLFADINSKNILVFFNLSKYLTSEELDSFLERAVFLQVGLLLIEGSGNITPISLVRYYRVDQDFCVFSNSQADPSPNADGEFAR